LRIWRPSSQDNLRLGIARATTEEAFADSMATASDQIS
jgi:hypothetical protein